MKKFNKILQITFINIAILAILLLSLEGLSRIVFPAQETKAIFNDQDLRVRNRPFVKHHPTRGFALKENFKNDLYTIDKNGFRVVPDTPNDVNFTILAMGESTTFGWMVKDNETYPYYLQQFLNQKAQHIQVINAGIPSYTSSQVLEYLKEILSKHTIKPNLILVNIMWNDIWYSSVQQWHPDILIYQKPPKWFVWLHKYSHLFNLLQEYFSSNKSQQTTDRFNQPALDKYADNIKQMIDIARQHNIAIAFVEPPLDADHLSSKGLNEFHITYTKPYLIKMGRLYYQTMRDIAITYHIPVINQSLGLEDIHQKNLFLDALHPTAQGNKKMAKDIAKQVSL
jgi:lysophospholipase L1-like esterase